MPIRNPIVIQTTKRPQSKDASEKKREVKTNAPTVGGTRVDSTLLRTQPLFPIAKEIKGMIYYDYQKVLTGGVGSVPTHYYSANGLYDPDVTGTGHQPMGWDQMMALYEQATVLRAHIKVTFASAGEHARVGIYLNPDTTSPGLPRLVENGLMIMDKVTGPSTANGQYAYSTLELACDIPKYFGRRRGEILADPQMYNTIASNPTEQVYFAVCAWAGFDAAADVTVAYDVTITFDAVFWEPKKLTSS